MYDPGLDYIALVVQGVEEATWQTNDLAQWCIEQGEHDLVEDHVAAIYKSGGITDFAARARMVEEAIHRQQQLHLERKQRRKSAAAEEMTKNKQLQGAEVSDSHLEAASPGLEDEALQTSSWSKVQAFYTQEEATTFVMECQPIDYRPACSAPFPRFDNSREALEYVLSLRPLPSEFVSVEAEFFRCLRVRHADPSELNDHKGRVRLLQMPGSRARRTSAQTQKDVKSWFVEGCGSLFKRVSPLRAIREVTARFYVAVAPEVEKRILLEGYKAKRRCSIPCSVTQQEALLAFSRNEERNGRPATTRAAVLGVCLTPEMGVDVVANRNGGFLIRTQELPRSCFSRVKRHGEST